MNGTALLGLTVTVTLLVVAVFLGSHLSIFFDAVSGILVCGVTGGLLVATHGLRTTTTRLLGGLGRLLLPDHFTPWTPEDAQEANHIASSAVRFSLLSGVLGGLIGFISMLQASGDLTALEPGTTLMVLSGFYSLVLTGLWFLPIARRFR